MCFSYTDIVCISGNFCATHAHNCGDVQSKTQISKMMRGYCKQAVHHCRARNTCLRLRT